MWHSRYVASAAPKFLRAVGFGLVMLLLSLLVGGQSATAAESEILTVICSQAQPATLTITAPESDSIINQNSFEISGNVTQTSQIDILVDGGYDQSLAIGADQTSFNATIQLSTGTHTVTLQAIDRCQVGNATANVVITYQPKVSQSTGSSTPTVVSPPERASGGGVAILSPPADAPPTANPLRPILTPIGQGMEALDLDVTFGRLNFINSFIRTVAIVGGSTLVVFGPLGLVWFWRLLRQRKRAEHWRSASLLRSGLLRLGGLVLLLLALVV